MMSLNLRQHQGLVCLLVLLCGGLNTVMCFTADPKDQTIPLGRMAFFSCYPSMLDAEEVAWIFFFPGDDLKLSTNAQQEILERRGFVFGSNKTHALVNMSASKSNNGTIIQCIENPIGFTAIFSDEAVLTVLGPPQSPGVRVLTPSAVEIFLEWGKPFTWPDYDILQYTITEMDSSSTKVRMFNTIHLNHTYLSLSGNVATTCNELTFTVSAISGLGSSLPALITTGLPILPADLPMELKISVRFRSNGDPELTVTIEPPAVCDYQRAYLILTMMQVDSNESMLVASRVYSGAPSTFIFHVLMRLITNANYTIVATLTTSTGNFSTLKQFDTILKQNGPGNGNDHTSLTLGVLGPLVGGIAGGLVLMVVLVVMLLVMILHVRRAKANLREAACATGDREGDCTYESIDDYQNVAQSACKNQYQKNMPVSSSARAESPYQPMKAADDSPTKKKTFTAFHDPLAPPHYTTCAVFPLELEANNNIQFTPDDSAGQFCQESVGVGSEDAYIAMEEVEESISHQERAHLSLVLPSSVSSYEDLANGECRLSIC